MKIKLPTTLGRLVALALATSVTSCNHDKLVSETPQPSVIASDAKVTDKDLEAVAKAFAKSLGRDAASRQFLKAEALKKYDGDFDVLYGAFTTKKPEFAQAVAGQVATDDDSKAAGGMTGILARIPNLNVSIPVNIDKWDAAGATPLVTFITSDYDKKGNNLPLKAFDKDGKVHWLDARSAPTFPVVVLGTSERINGNPAKDKRYLKKGVTVGESPSGGISFLYPADETPIEEGGGGGGGGGYYPPPQPYANCRNDKQNEHLRSIWMEDVSVYEAWARGDAEVELKVFFVAGSSVSSFEDGWKISRGDVENTWTCNNPLFYWDKNSTGSAVKFVWYEEDTGAEITIATTLKGTLYGQEVSTTITYKLTDGDDEIGTSTIDYEFCPSQKYYNYHGGTDEEFRWTMDSQL